MVGGIIGRAPLGPVSVHPVCGECATPPARVRPPTLHFQPPPFYFFVHLPTAPRAPVCARAPSHLSCGRGRGAEREKAGRGEVSSARAGAACARCVCVKNALRVGRGSFLFLCFAPVQLSRPGQARGGDRLRGRRGVWVEIRAGCGPSYHARRDRRGAEWMKEMVEQGEGGLPGSHTLHLGEFTSEPPPHGARARARGALSLFGVRARRRPFRPTRRPELAHYGSPEPRPGHRGGWAAGRRWRRRRAGGGPWDTHASFAAASARGRPCTPPRHPPPAPGLPPTTRPHHPPPGVGQCNCSPSRARAGGRMGPKPPIAAEEKGACGGGARARERQRERALAAAPPSISEARRPRPRPARADAPATHL